MQRFGLTDLLLCEVLQGINDEKLFTRVLQELSRPVVLTIDWSAGTVAFR